MQKDLDPSGLVFRAGKNKGKPTVEVDSETGCWIWQGSRHKGYGKLWNGKFSTHAHIVYYEQFVGPVPEGCELGHNCHRRSCANPLHVTPVTRAVNQGDRYKVPTLSVVVRDAIAEDFDNDVPNGHIAAKYGISVYAVRAFARKHAWRNQTSLDLDDVPF